MPRETGGGAAADEIRTKEEVQCANRAAACDLCGLEDNWHETNTRGSEVADSRLQDDKLVRVARVIALWEQMKLVGTSIGNFDGEQMAMACTWLETGAQSSETSGNNKYWSIGAHTIGSR
jgi:hypothetical protein